VPSVAALERTFDPDLPVRVDDRRDEVVAVALTVTRRSTDAVVHEATVDVEPGRSREVYDLREADPTGIERYRVAATADGRTAATTVETDACHAGVSVVVADGEVRVGAVIC
jgi:hypothetical protein